MFGLAGADKFERLFVIWAFVLQILLIVHFAIRKPLFESYTLKFGWLVYALCIPAAIISIILLRGGKIWSFWAGGFIFIAFAAFGFWVDYIARIPFRSSIQASILAPYVFLYLATVMFYWWPLALISRPLWFVYAALFVIATVLNITSH